MPSVPVAALLVAAGLAVGAGGMAAAGALSSEDLEVMPITVAASEAAEPTRLVVEDGVTAEAARRLAAAAAEHVGGRAITVEREDGLFQVDVRDRAGAIVEVLLDDGGRVVGVDAGEDD